ncbi:MAG: hypothetical protein RIT81_41395 [Deltaproteobacteria bacterium]
MIRGDSLEGAIAATLAYADVFSFAMKPSEVHRFLLGRRASRPEVERCLSGNNALRSLISTRDGLWFLAGKDHLAPRRQRFARHSEFLWPRARHIAKTMERTGLCLTGMVTGSLAADNADEHADIDFLFIYPAERTWTSFAAVRLIKNWPALSSCCPNYVLASDRLLIQPQNLFTAWEIAKAVPLFGYDVYEQFIAANRWVGRYLPNALPLVDQAPEPAPLREDPSWVRTLTSSGAFRWLEERERRRKHQTDKRDVGVDMKDRDEKGSMDRHSPTRSFHTLSELRYRMSTLGLEAHPIFTELYEATNMLEDEMTRWGADAIRTEAG